MRRALAVLLALGWLAGCAGTGDYVSLIASGDIVHLEEGAITLESGATYLVPPERTFLLQDLTLDRRVTIKYRPTDDGNILQDVMPAAAIVRTRS